MWASPTSRLDLSVPCLTGSRRVSLKDFELFQNLYKVGNFSLPQIILDDSVPNKHFHNRRGSAWAEVRLSQHFDCHGLGHFFLRREL